MSKLVGIKTYERFRSLWENNGIDEFSLNFIIDTGLLYTHGIFINGAVFGTAANGAVPLSVAGITNTLALSSHTHSNYLEKNKDIDISSYKIKSGNKDLLFYSGGSLYLGNINSPTYISGSNLYSVRGTNTYDILDTSNFSISNTLPTGYTYNNTAYIKYGGSSHQIDYVKRINTSLSFDYLNTYTLAGTNLLNGVQYGYITLYTDNVYTNPSWAQLRINIPSKSIQYRTSADTNNWIGITDSTAVKLGTAGATNITNGSVISAASSSGIIFQGGTNSFKVGNGTNSINVSVSHGLSTKNITINGSTYALYTSASSLPTFVAPGSYGTANYILATNSSGNGLTWVVKPTSNVTTTAIVGSSATATSQITAAQTNPYYNLLEGGSVTRSIRFVAGNGITISAGTDGQITITNSKPHVADDTNTWRPIKVNGTEKRGTAITSGDLDFINGSNTTVEWTSDNKLKINSTWTAWKGATDSANGTAGYMPAPTSALRGQFLRGDGSWVSLNNYSLPTASNSTLGGVKTGAAITDTTGYTAVAIKDGVIYYKDTNSTYSFYNLLFQNSSGTTVDTYKPTTSPTKTLKAGSNVTISAASNVITIASTNTWNANAVGVAGYVAAPTKAANANMTWLTDAEGVPAWRASNNHSHSYLPLAGGEMTGAIKRYYSAASNDPVIALTSYNLDVWLWRINHGTSANVSTSGVYGFGLKYIGTGNGNNNLVLYADALSGTQIAAMTMTQDGVIKLSSTPNVNGTNVSLAGHKHAYTDLTGSGTTANQAIVSTGTANGWTLKTLGSRAFDSTSYLPLSGGTLTNTLTISTGGDSKLIINNTDSETYYSWIRFQQKGETYGSLGTAGTTALTWNNHIIYHAGNLPAYPTKSSWNYDDMYVSSLTTSGNYLRWIKNGSNNDITIPYATSASRIKYIAYSNNSADPGTLLAGGGITRNYGSSNYWKNCPSGLSYGACIEFYAGDESLSGQFIWDVNHNSASSTRYLYFRASNNLGWLNDWKRIPWASEIPTKASWNYDDVYSKLGHNHNSSYVLSVSISGNNLRVTKNGSNSDLTIPYATNATNATVLLTDNTSQAADNCYSGAPGLRFWRYNGTSSTTGQSGGDGWILSWSWNTGSVGGQIYLDDNPSKTICIRGYNNADGGSFTTWSTILHTGNSSVSKSGETLTVNIGGTSQSLTNTNTWRGILDNLTSSSNTTESLSAKQGYLLANGSARDNTKIPLFRYGTTGTTAKIKININSTASWMLCFTVTLYQGYRATKVMISGYQYGSNYWYLPEACILGDGNGTETISVYFGYDAATKLWVGFDGGEYTGVSINDVTNGYSQISDFSDLFTISNVSSLTTLQTTVTAASKANYANSAGNADTVDSEHASAFAHRGAANNLVHFGNEITMIPDSYSGALYFNYQSVGRNSSANITQYNFCDGKGGTLASITSGTFNGNCTGSAGSVAWSNVTSKPGATGNATTPVYWNGSGFTNCTAYGSASVNYANYSGYSNKVLGSYTSNGGKQNPDYFGKNRVGFLMMNTTVNENSQYKDWVIMDCYSGSDVGGGVAIGVNRQSLGAYIMRSAAERTSWAESAELIGTHNYTTYTVKKDGTGATGTWGINITGNATNVTGVVAIANGGTGASTRLNALKNLTNESVSTSAQYFLTITSSWGKGGYTSVADAKTVLAMTGATSSANGTAGVVSAPPKDGYNTKFLRADGTWSVPAYPTKASWNYDDVYLKLSGGTMTGEIMFNTGMKSTVGIKQVYNNTSGGSAFNQMSVFMPDGTGVYRIATLFSGTTFRYGFIGTGLYNDSNNLRIYPDHPAWGDNTIWHAGNDGSGSGLDADKLDGLHSNEFPIMSLNGVTELTSGDTCDLTNVGTYYTTSKTISASLTNTPFTESNFRLWHFKTGLTNYPAQLAISFREGMAMRGKNNTEWYDWKYFAFKDDNVASATKLQTPRTIWGKSFDGTANVSGDITVGAGNIILNNGAHVISKDKDGNTHSVLRFNSTNGLLIGSGLYDLEDSSTHIYGGSNIRFHVGSTGTKMCINSNGNVGIGTTSPANALDVVGHARAKTLSFYNRANSANAGYIGAGSSSVDYIYLQGYKNNGVFIGANNGFDLVILPNHNVGVGTIEPSYKFHVNGNVGASNFYTTSDRTKKQNISSFSEHIRKFQLKDTEKWHYGVIAQEVPEIFRDGKEGNMTVNYNSVLSYYVGCLENRVKELEDKLAKYEELKNK